MKKQRLLFNLKGLIRPAIKFAIRYGFHIQDLLEATKQVFIEEAAESLKQEGGEPNISKLSIVTGMHRRDVMRIYRDSEVKEEPLGLLNRIIGQWQNDKRFCSRPGVAKDLNLLTGSNEFHQLVQEVSNDLNPGTVLAELLRLGIAKKNKNKLRLLSLVFDSKKDLQQALSSINQEINNLYQAVEENLYVKDRTPNLHGTTEFDNINSNFLPEIRQWLYHEGSKFHSKARKYLSQFDLDINSTSKRLLTSGEKSRVSLTTFSLSKIEGV